MSNPFAPVLVAGTPGRGSVTQPDLTIYCQSLQIQMAWGISPAEAVLTYVNDSNQPDPVVPVSTGALLTITSGGHTFYGVCVQDSGVDGSDGQKRTLQFVDTRKYLDDDYVFGAFNLPDVYTDTETGLRVRGYKHLYPADYDGWNWTYTPGPLTAAEILDAMFAAPTVLTGWARLYHSDQENYPVYGIDCLSGRKLGAAIQEVSSKQGLVVGLQGGRYRLVWVRKGVGVLPGFPSNSDRRRSGTSLSGNATRVLVVGDRNLYQVLNVPMVKDWVTAWEEFVVFELFAEDIYQRAVNPKTGVRFNATPGDPEQFIGRQLALAYASEITVREYAALRGAAFADYRKFGGRSRMDMPVALYIRTLLFRAFRPDLTSFGNISGTGVGTLQIEDRLLARVSYSPTTGVMSASVNEPADGNGFAIVRGYKVGSDNFKSLKPEQFGADLFSDARALWQPVPFQIDDGGEGDRFLIFDEPVVVSENLLTKVDGHTVINRDFTLTVPSVRAALTFAAEPYVYRAGVAGKDHVENVSQLHGEYVVNGSSITEVRYQNGQTADQIADDIAQSLLLNQYYYAGGGYEVRGSNGTQINSIIDRVSYQTGPNGTSEIVDFTTERGRNYFEPERRLDRLTREEALLPGQEELRQQAAQARLVAEAFKQNPRVVKALGDLLFGTVENEVPLQTVYVKGGTSAAIAVGTPLRKRSLTVGASTTANTNTLAVLPAGAAADDKIFGGVTVRANERANGPVRVQMSGVALVRVRGPVNENDSVGLGSGTEDYLVKDSTVGTVGLAHQKITDASTKLIPVRIGGGGGAAGGKVQRMRISAEGDDTLTCQKVASDGTVIAGSFTVAKPPTLRLSFWNNQTFGLWRYSGTKNSRSKIYAGTAVPGGLQPGDNLTENLEPSYTAGMDIYASEAEGATSIAAGAGVFVTWIDLNVDSREFKATQERVDMCRVVNGVSTQYKMVVEGGPAQPR